MTTLLEQTLAGSEMRERQSRAISRVIDIALSVLIVLCLLLWRERYNVIEVKNGEISLTQVYRWGCRARELRRVPTAEIASVSINSNGQGACVVTVYDQAGDMFDCWVYSIYNADRAYEVKERILHALSGKSAYRASHSTQTRYLIFALVLTVITVIRWWMIKTVRKADEEQDRQWADKRNSRALNSLLNEPEYAVSGNGWSKSLSANRLVQFRKGPGRNHKTV